MAWRVNRTKGTVTGLKEITICDRRKGNGLQPVLFRPPHFLESCIGPASSDRTTAVHMIRMGMRDQDLCKWRYAQSLSQCAEVSRLACRRIKKGSRLS